MMELPMSVPAGAPAGTSVAYTPGTDAAGPSVRALTEAEKDPITGALKPTADQWYLTPDWYYPGAPSAVGLDVFSQAYAAPTAQGTTFGHGKDDLQLWSDWSVGPTAGEYVKGGSLAGIMGLREGYERVLPTTIAQGIAAFAPSVSFNTLGQYQEEIAAALIPGIQYDPY